MITNKRLITIFASALMVFAFAHFVPAAGMASAGALGSDRRGRSPGS